MVRRSYRRTHDSWSSMLGHSVMGLFLDCCNRRPLLKLMASRTVPTKSPQFVLFSFVFPLLHVNMLRRGPSAEPPSTRKQGTNPYASAQTLQKFDPCSQLPNTIAGQDTTLWDLLTVRERRASEICKKGVRLFFRCVNAPSKLRREIRRLVDLHPTLEASLADEIDGLKSHAGRIATTSDLCNVHAR
jgi:hypothetical protein